MVPIFLVVVLCLMAVIFGFAIGLFVSQFIYR